jgi:carboxyl-terminal processing protease
MPKLADGRACRGGGSRKPPAAMPFCPAAAFAPAAVLAVVAMLAGCAQYEPLPADPHGRLYAHGLDEISELYIAPVSSRSLALEGANRLSSLDPRLSVFETPGVGAQTDVVLGYAGREVAVHTEPNDDDPHVWGAFLGRLVADAKAASGSVSALPADRIDTAVFLGMTRGLDRFSRYASPQAARDQRALRDGFGGVGLTLDVSGAAVRVASVMPGGPAELAGIRPGDRIVAIDGIATAGRPETDVVRQLRGPVPSTVEVSVSRHAASSEQSFRLSRTLTVTPTVSMTRDGDVAILRVASFNQATTREFVRDLQAALHEAQVPLRGIVLDLRGDPGGLLDQAVSLADVFIPGGHIVATTGRHPASRQLFDAAGDSLVPRIPVVVLINGGSASASEVVAAALQDAGRAVVVGSSSYGKGTVQTIIRLPNEGELSLTWALLLAPSGYYLNGHGVVPTLCTSDLKDDAESLRIALQRAGSVAISPLTPRPRASLSDADWSQLRRSCRARTDKPAIDMIVAERLLADPELFGEAVHVIARNPKLADDGAQSGLTRTPASLLSGIHLP